MPHPPPPPTHPILHSLLSLIASLATAPSTESSKLEEYLARISQLPAIRCVLDEEEEEGDGRESEVSISAQGRMEGFGDVTDMGQMFIYFKGVGILLRELMGKIKSERDARGFLEGVGKIQQEIFPAGEAKDHIFSFEQNESASEPAPGTWSQPSKGPISHGTPMGAMNPGCDGLPRITQSQLDEEIARLEAGCPQVGTNNDNDLIVTGARSIKRKLLPDDELTLPQHDKRPRSAGAPGYLRGLTIEDLNLNQRAHPPTLHPSQHFSQHPSQHPSQQANTEAWLIWRLVTDAAMEHPGLRPAVSPLMYQGSNKKAWRKIEKSVFDAVGLLTGILVKEGIQQVRALEKEYIPRESQAGQTLPPTIPWPSLFQLPAAGNIRSLALCLRHYSARKTALDRFGENFARAELYRTWSNQASTGLATSSVEGVEPGKGEQLYFLACAFGIGILALVPNQLQLSLQYTRPDALKHVISSIRVSKAHGIYEKIEDVSRRARVMMLAVVEGTSLEFRLAIEDVVERLESFY